MNTPETEINVEKLARLSMLNLNDGEKTRIEKDLMLLVEYANTVMTQSDIIQSSPNVNKNALREDIESAEKYDDIAKLSPSYSNGYITVPKVLDV